MRICYVDESGDGRLPDLARPDVPPALVVCGLVVESEAVPDLTRDFLAEKDRFHPGRAGSRPLDGILKEVKGSDIKEGCSWLATSQTGSNRILRQDCLASFHIRGWHYWQGMDQEAFRTVGRARDVYLLDSGYDTSIGAPCLWTTD